MKRLLLAGASIAILSGSALAADMPLKSPPYVPPAAYDWSGIYFGINGGWAHSHVNWAFDPAIPAAVNQSFALSKDGGIIGGHAGIQKQFGMWVLGAEVAYDATSRGWITNQADYGNNAAQFAAAKLNNIFTVGPRVGYAPSDKWMLFATGGYAHTNIDTGSITKATGVEVAAQHASASHDGWYIGVGGEYAITQNIIAGVEYQHVQFRSALHCPPAFGTCAGGAAVFADRDIDASVDIVRARLSYKFNFFGPVSSRY